MRALLIVCLLVSVADADAKKAIRTKEHDETTSWENDPQQTTVDVDLALTARWAEGSLELKGKGKGANKDEVGKHAVVFP